MISEKSAIMAWNTAKAAFQMATPTFTTAWAKAETAVVKDAVMAEEYVTLLLPTIGPYILYGGQQFPAPQRSKARRDVNELYTTRSKSNHY